MEASLASHRRTPARCTCKLLRPTCPEPRTGRTAEGRVCTSRYSRGDTRPAVWSTRAPDPPQVDGRYVQANQGVFKRQCICKRIAQVEGVGVLHGATDVVGTMNGTNMTTIWTIVLGLLAYLSKAERIPEDQFGKSVFYQRALDEDLTSECASNTFCLDRAVSRGSCYHSDSDDTHIGNAVLCDVSEIECCGYEGCGDPDNRGNHPNGDAHNYYWYATGYRAGFSPFAGEAGGCCHCAAGCNFGEQQAAREERNVTGSCIYRDVTSTACQRATDQARPEEGEEDRRIGHLRCPIPGTFSLSDATIREAVPPPPSPSPSPGGGPGGNDPLNTPENAGMTFKVSAWLMTAFASLLSLAQPGRSVSAVAFAVSLLQLSSLGRGHYVWLDIDDTHAKVSFREVPGGSTAPIDWLGGKEVVWMQSPESGSKALHMIRMADEIVGEVQVSAKAPVYLSGTATFGVHKVLNASSPPLIIYHYNTQYVDSKGSWRFVSEARQLDEGIFLEPGSECLSVGVKVKWVAHEGAGTRVRVFDSLGDTIHDFLHPGGESLVSVTVPRTPEVIYALASAVSNEASSYQGQSYKQVNHYGTSSLNLRQCRQDGVDIPIKQGATQEAASVARWLVEKLNYGFLSTKETVEGNAKPFGNVISFANGHNKSLDTGRLFFYASNMDRSGQDLVRDSMCSFTLTEAQIDGTCANTDAQDAICAKVIFTGHMMEIINAADRAFAEASLFDQNPPMKNWPADHNWKVMELHPTSIFVLYHYGGADDVPLDDYYKASPQPAPPHYQQIAVMPRVNIPRPETQQHEQMARWMVHILSWGVLHTISTNLDGAPFGHVVSFSDADASGRIFVYMTKMSPSLRDVDTNPWVSLSLSEAQVVSQFKDGLPCRGEIAEEPTCARLTLSGKLEKVSQSEITLARNSVFGRHRTMWRWPKNHKFEFYELKVAQIFFIDFYGGVKPMSTKQYLQAKVQNGIIEAWNDLYLPEELFAGSGTKCSSTIFPWVMSGFLVAAVAILVLFFYQRRRRAEYMQVEIKDSEKDTVQSGIRSQGGSFTTD